MAGLYFHIPFCAKRCVYCDFYFVTTQHNYGRFIDALLLEIEHQATNYAKLEPIETIYFGGGTPSLLAIDDFARILNQIEKYFDISDLKEFTVEVNPDDLNQNYLEGLRAIGVNRLSIGIQSFYEDDLHFMKRAHTQDQAVEAIELAQKTGFSNYSVDLIFGLPNQPLEYWGANLEKICNWNVPHLSTYNLTIESGTPLYKQMQKGAFKPSDDQTLHDLYVFTIDYLVQKGYEHYEISSFAKEGFRSIHNHNYWSHKNYLGFGPSAHSFWWHEKPYGKVYRWANLRYLKGYEQALLNWHRLPVETHEQLSPNMLANEAVMLRIRTADGINIEKLSDYYGFDLWSERAEVLAWLEEESYVQPIRNDLLILTPSGKLLCDAITAKLIV